MWFLCNLLYVEPWEKKPWKKWQILPSVEVEKVILPFPIILSYDLLFYHKFSSGSEEGKWVLITIKTF